MNVFPVNKMILVELSEEEQEVTSTNDTILVPAGYRPASQHAVGFILDVAEDCDSDLSVGDEIVFDSTMVQEVAAHGETHYLLKENFVLCVLEEEEDD